MKKVYVYVCYKAFEYEGCTEPECVFKKEQDAIDWVNKGGIVRNSRRYEKLEIE